MILDVDQPTHPLTQQWASALDGFDIRHHDPAVTVEVHLIDSAQPLLAIRCINPIDTAKPPTVRLADLAIGTSRLTYFPGGQLARVWLAVAWAGYVQHEALELVTVRGYRPCDPHEPMAIASRHRLAPYVRDRGLRDGLPPELTPKTLLHALATAMDVEVAKALILALGRED